MPEILKKVMKFRGWTFYNDDMIKIYSPCKFLTKDNTCSLHKKNKPAHCKQWNCLHFPKKTLRRLQK